jgi:hypothetical protein
VTLRALKTIIIAEKIAFEIARVNRLYTSFPQFNIKFFNFIYHVISTQLYVHKLSQFNNQLFNFISHVISTQLYVQIRLRIISGRYQTLTQNYVYMFDSFVADAGGYLVSHVVV